MEELREEAVIWDRQTKEKTRGQWELSIPAARTECVQKGQYLGLKVTLFNSLEPRKLNPAFSTICKLKIIVPK